MSILLDIDANDILLIIGVGLVVFASTLSVIAYSKILNSKAISSIIWMDWLWVVGSIIVIALNPFGISIIGLFLIGIVACVVGLFAILQGRAHKRINSLQ
jgi:hypothetical protein